jgi:AbrB family looped-hinge helix DNA binding protein
MDCNFGDLFYGSVTVGERGQIAIPAQARSELGFSPGDKLLVMRHPIHKGLMIFKFEDVQAFLTEMGKNLDRLQETSEAGEE